MARIRNASLFNFRKSFGGGMAIDYSQKAMDGARFLTQLGSKSDGLMEHKRAARYSKGWRFPHAFCMESSKGYWRRYVLPKIDIGKGVEEYRGSSPEGPLRVLIAQPSEINLARPISAVFSCSQIYLLKT